MGARGPAGKHPDRRHGHGSKASRAHDVVPAGAALDWPAVVGSWHPAAKRWYRSLRESGQVVDYVQSDTAFAHLVADQLSRELNEPGPMASSALTAFMAANNSLLATAGSRRRVGMEITRAQDPQEGAHLAAVESLADRRPRTEPDPDGTADDGSA